MGLQKNKQRHYSGKEPDKPILYQPYYIDKESRNQAVKRHFEDLVRNEMGNKPMEYVFQYFDEKIIDHKYKKIILLESTFRQLLNNVLTTYKSEEGMKHQTVETLTEMLITNGIVKKENHGRGNI